MDDDVQIKVIFMGGMVIIYTVTVTTQKPDVGSLAAMLSAVTNAIVGVFAYNWAKKQRIKRAEIEHAKQIRERQNI
jgi:hypothetical protein